jgi:CheY-like chemotaxis protein
MSATINCSPRLEPSFMADQAPVVFIVDDDVSVRESLEGLVAELGWQPRTFASAQAFLAEPPPTSPNCLVLDVSLPDLNGLEVQRRVAGERGDMPIIFITGHGDIPMSVTAMKAGAVEFLTKPFTNEEGSGYELWPVDVTEKIKKDRHGLTPFGSTRPCLLSRVCYPRACRRAQAERSQRPQAVSKTYPCCPLARGLFFVQPALGAAGRPGRTAELGLFPGLNDAAGQTRTSITGWLRAQVIRLSMNDN